MENYLNDLEITRNKLMIAMMTEPTSLAISELEPNVSHGSELEVVLMEMKAITTIYNQVEKNLRNEKKGSQ